MPFRVQMFWERKQLFVSSCSHWFEQCQYWFWPSIWLFELCVCVLYTEQIYSLAQWSTFPSLTCFFCQAFIRIFYLCTSGHPQKCWNVTDDGRSWNTAIKKDRAPAVPLIHPYPVSPLFSSQFQLLPKYVMGLWSHTSCDWGHANLEFDVLGVFPWRFQNVFSGTEHFQDSCEQKFEFLPHWKITELKIIVWRMRHVRLNATPIDPGS